MFDVNAATQSHDGGGIVCSLNAFPARAATGVSIVSGICLTGAEKLAVIPMSLYFPKRTYGLVLREGRFLSSPAQRFIEVMRSSEAACAGRQQTGSA